MKLRNPSENPYAHFNDTNKSNIEVFVFFVMIITKLSFNACFNMEDPLDFVFSKMLKGLNQ